MANDKTVRVDMAAVVRRELNEALRAAIVAEQAAWDVLDRHWASRFGCSEGCDVCLPMRNA
ncbi:hypothetical protein, partial [Staphylococcus aureus]|uniref:hypothetical protein n=1 Tax=Staphylococcus aureus TaxID=1280 RepID=UPI0039BE1A21